MGYYVTNDADCDYFHHYVLESFDEEDYYTGLELDELLRDVEKIVGKEVKTLDEAINAIEDYNNDKEYEEDWYKIKVFKIV